MHDPFDNPGIADAPLPCGGFRVRLNVDPRIRRVSRRLAPFRGGAFAFLAPARPEDHSIVARDAWAAWHDGSLGCRPVGCRSDRGARRFIETGGHHV